MFQVHPFAFLAVVAVTMCWGLAIVLFRVGMPGGAARKLALLLFLEGVTLGSSDAGVVYWLVSPDDFYALYPAFGMVQGVIHTLGDVGMLALYPPFLAVALQTRLTRPFSSKRVQSGLAAAAVALFLFVVVAQSDIAFSILYLAMTATFIFALIASIHAWLTATGAARERAFFFVLAFGFRDICWTFVYSIALWEIWVGWENWLPDDPINFFRLMSYDLGTLVAVPLIAYGILRAQLFDIDLRIRWTIKQSTLVAAIVAIMFVLSEGAERLLSTELGNVGSLIVAALVVFALTPLQRFAERVATVAMPNTVNTPEYAASRKLQVYESAIEEALQEGGISQKERSLLVRLRESLGISESDANAIERELQDGLPGPA